MLRLYIANKNYSSWSLRPWVLMRELRIEFEERLERFRGDATGAEFQRFSPSAKVPCLHDGETIVWDSLAIVEYLAEDHPHVWPESKAARAWARSASAEMHSSFGKLRQICGMNIGVRVALTAVSSGLASDIERLGSLWEQGLEHFGGPFLAGERFTAVDAFFTPAASRCQTYNLSLSKPAQAYCMRLLQQPAMLDWTRAALAETWRDDAHEAELTRYGRVVQDLRARG